MAPGQWHRDQAALSLSVPAVAVHKEGAQGGCTRRVHKEDAQGGCTRRVHKEEVVGIPAVVVPLELDHLRSAGLGPRDPQSRLPYPAARRPPPPSAPPPPPPPRPRMEHGRADGRADGRAGGGRDLDGLRAGVGEDALLDLKEAPPTCISSGGFGRRHPTPSWGQARPLGGSHARAV